MDEHQKKLELAIGSLEKSFGKGTIMRLGKREVVPVEVVPSGSLALDLALGIGGWPRGRIVETFGPESSGKTTMALHAVAEAQKLGGTCAFVDAEHALDLEYAKGIGVNADELLVSQPDCGEQALEVVDVLVRSGEVAVIVVDSVAALVPKAELEGEMGDAHVGLQARLMSQALRKLTAIVAKSNTLIIFINQIRMKIGVMFGSPETTTGGNALKFYASIRLDVRRIGAVTGKPKLKMGEERPKEDKSTSLGNRTRAKVVKNKCAPPFREAEFDIIYGKGIDSVGETLDFAVRAGLVEQSGAWYALRGERIGQGRENTKTFLREHQDIAEALRDEVMTAIKAGKVKAEVQPPEE
jgi:recombination protein RecA